MTENWGAALQIRNENSKYGRAVSLSRVLGEGAREEQGAVLHPASPAPDSPPFTHERLPLLVILWLSISNPPLYKDISTELGSVLKVLNPMTYTETRFLRWGDLPLHAPSPKLLGPTSVDSPRQSASIPDLSCASPGLPPPRLPQIRTHPLLHLHSCLHYTC